MTLLLSLPTQPPPFSGLPTRNHARWNEFRVTTSYHEENNEQPYCEATAGDMVQSYWCRKHQQHMGKCFQHVPIKNEIARWLRLPYMMLPKKIATKVWWWHEHHMADFHQRGLLSCNRSVDPRYDSFCSFSHFLASTEMDTSTSNE